MALRYAQACRPLWRMLFILALTFFPISIIQASADVCTTRYSDDMEGVSLAGSMSIAVSGFPVSCRGSIQGSLYVMNGKVSNVQLIIEEHVNGNWVPVAQGHSVNHKVDPAIYRMVVAHTGTKGAGVRWRLRYSKPLP